jgi:hypothetical protein
VPSRTPIGRRDHLTFKGNLARTRYGWLRLTPAYSVHQVEELLGEDKDALILDPFCGTGTTALVCAERGIACDTTDINPFLVWLATAKASAYEAADVDSFMAASARVADAMRTSNGRPAWVPPLHRIDKWWDEKTVAALSQAQAAIQGLEASLSRKAANLLKVAFCRTMMDHAHVSFGHQSMSFKKKRQREGDATFLPGLADHPVAGTWEQTVPMIATAARSPIRRQPRVLLLDARDPGAGLEAEHYSRVITSPPYCNRISYIRELRPYMYWLGFLTDGRGAGELDWQAIGGTWGCATSNLTKWQPEPAAAIPYPGFEDLLRGIAARSDVLSRYVRKYFCDMAQHCQGLFRCVRPGGTVHYIVGNSKFYGVLLPAQEILASLFRAAGFTDALVQATRKRTSKKELFEYVVSARKPGGLAYRPSGRGHEKSAS